MAVLSVAVCLWLSFIWLSVCVCPAYGCLPVAVLPMAVCLWLSAYGCPAYGCPTYGCHAYGCLTIGVLSMAVCLWLSAYGYLPMVVLPMVVLPMAVCLWLSCLWLSAYGCPTYGCLPMAVLPLAVCLYMYVCIACGWLVWYGRKPWHGNYSTSSPSSYIVHIHPDNTYQLIQPHYPFFLSLCFCSFLS